MNENLCETSQVFSNINKYDSTIRSISSYKVPIASNADSHKMTRNTMTTEEWRTDNTMNITDENDMNIMDENDMNVTNEDNVMYEDNMNENPDQTDVLDYLKNQYVSTKRDSFRDLSNRYEDTNYSTESEIHKNGNADEIDDNANSSYFVNNNTAEHCKENDNAQRGQKRNMPKISAVQILQNRISIPLQKKKKLE
ncbi:hypothetical protein DMN91_007320 [Ooceraea biroi]|uniref:Uncharacterized protein n=2 Tax=Ooceraea biroi TaxID=2015173 RepID=A0A3L8DJX6_OOCBI|nr:hypothetical protein DMN91_007320 [Ooceraea biroi]